MSKRIKITGGPYVPISPEKIQESNDRIAKAMKPIVREHRRKSILSMKKNG